MNFQRFDARFLALGGFNIGKLSSFPFSIWDGLENNRYKGHALGGGIAYGYAWMLGKHWNLEAEVGVGYAHAWFDQYSYADEGKEVLSNGNKNYWGITKLAISFVYLF